MSDMIFWNQYCHTPCSTRTSTKAGVFEGFAWLSIWSESILHVDSCCKSKYLCKRNFWEDLAECMKKKLGTGNVKEQVCSVFQSFQTRALARVSYINSQLFILQFIAWRHSNLEPELIMLLPSRNFGTLSLWMELEWAGSACVSTSNEDTSNGSAEKL